MDTIRTYLAVQGPVDALAVLSIVGAVLVVAYLLWACYAIIGSRRG